MQEAWIHSYVAMMMDVRILNLVIEVVVLPQSRNCSIVVKLFLLLESFSIFFNDLRSKVY